MTDARAFRGFRFPAEIILWAVRWYLQFPLSYRDLEAMLADRGVEVDHTSMYRWVQRFAPELEKRVRRHLRPCRGPWHVDETYHYFGTFQASIVENQALSPKGGVGLSA
jgi:transposase, IS6 family